MTNGDTGLVGSHKYIIQLQIQRSACGALPCTLIHTGISLKMLEVAVCILVLQDYSTQFY